MKKYLILLISAMVVICVIGISSSQARIIKRAAPAQIELPKAPPVFQTVTVKGLPPPPPPYGMPLTSQEQADCYKYLRDVAHMINPIHIAVAAGTAPSHEQTESLRTLIKIAFPIEDSSGLGPRITEDSLAKLITVGTPENTAYEKTIKFLDMAQTRLTAVKDILRRYDGVLDNSRQRLVLLFDEHIVYYKTLKSDFFEDAYDYALNHVNPDDGINYGLEGEGMLELDEDLQTIGEFYTNYSNIFEHPTHKGVPTEEGQGKKRPPLRSN